MNIDVEYKDVAGKIHNQSYYLSRIAFVKHLAIAGQGYAPTPQKLMRTIGMLLHYGYFLQRGDFYNNNRFSEPPTELSDPTEKGQFSNLAGKAIADFLSKKIGKSIFTVNYEAAMRLQRPPIPVRGQRPDLIAYTQNIQNTPNAMFALEAKGFSGGAGNMVIHKNQSTTGGIRVNYTVACVSYNLFSRTKCNYHDPFNDNVSFDNSSLAYLTRKYYKGLTGFLNQKIFEYREIEFQGEKFYLVELAFRYFEKYLWDDFHPFWSEIFHFYKPRLILPKNIFEFAEKGIGENVAPFLFENNDSNYSIYIDNDRVGLEIRRF
jgi:hypothetical protein